MKELSLTIVIYQDLNNFLSNVIKLLGISQNDCEAFVKEIRYRTLKAILEYRRHPRRHPRGEILHYPESLLSWSSRKSGF